MEKDENRLKKKYGEYRNNKEDRYIKVYNKMSAYLGINSNEREIGTYHSRK